MKKESLYKYVISNLAIVLVISSIFMVTLIYSPISNVSSVSGAIYQGSSTTSVSFMVNVYSGTEYVNQMLDIFESENIYVTFFVGGLWVEDNEETLINMHKDGHEIGNHGYLHKNHSELTREGNITEINLTHSLVKDIIDFDMNLFAPPSGDYDSATVDIASELGYKTIMWTNDTIDWRDQDEELIYTRATSDIKGGNLILMHPTSSTVSTLPRIINEIKSNGYNIQPVSLVL